ncbi:hypothetical protein CNEO4_170053 [Clostridium neonatale]|nr:hypothetical protein CNEO4_170053 [Clostridium neonatale]
MYIIEKVHAFYMQAEMHIITSLSNKKINQKLWCKNGVKNKKT